MSDESGMMCGPHDFSNNDIITGTRDSRGTHISVIIPVNS
jgi:hypothetical protein